jgi:hypothetical protein
MEEIQLSETEQRYFGDLFVCCDSDNTGKIPVYKASELFRSANLPLDVLKQVIKLNTKGQSIIGHELVQETNFNHLYTYMSLRVSVRLYYPQARMCFEPW